MENYPLRTATSMILSVSKLEDSLYLEKEYSRNDKVDFVYGMFKELSDLSKNVDAIDIEVLTSKMRLPEKLIYDPSEDIKSEIKYQMECIKGAFKAFSSVMNDDEKAETIKLIAANVVNYDLTKTPNTKVSLDKLNSLEKVDKGASKNKV